MSHQSDPVYQTAVQAIALGREPQNVWVQDVNAPQWNGSQWLGGQYINLVNAVAAINDGRADFVDTNGNLLPSARQELTDRVNYLRPYLAVSPGVSVTTGGSNTPKASQADIDFVRSQYARYSQPADDAGMAFWVNELTTGRKDRNGVAQAFDVAFAVPTGMSPGTNLIGGAPGGVPVIGGQLQPQSSTGMSPLILIGLAIGAYFLLKD